MGKLNCRWNEYQCDLIILQITEGNNSAYQVTPSRSTCTIPMSFYFSVNKQLADKERIAAALENTHLLKVVNQCLTVKQWEQELKCTSRKLQRTHSSWIPVFFCQHSTPCTNLFGNPSCKHARKLHQLLHLVLLQVFEKAFFLCKGCRGMKWTIVCKTSVKLLTCGKTWRQS